MRQISTLFVCVISFLSTVYAQDPGNLKIPGLEVLKRSLPLTTSNGETVIRRKCNATLSNDKPLLVIDGIIAEKFDLKNIDPNDIECISILKNGEATTLFGCMAASGVIVITTKTANHRTIIVKDLLTGELLTGANVDLIPTERKSDTVHLITDSLGKVVTNKIGSGKEYELKVTNVGYKPFRAIINTKQLGKNHIVLIQRNHENLKEVENQFSNIKFYPNPLLHSQKVNIEVEIKEEGKVSLRLFSLDGKLIDSKEYQTLQGINKICYFMNAQLASGIYVLQLIDKNNHLAKTEKLILQ